MYNGVLAPAWRNPVATATIDRLSIPAAGDEQEQIEQLHQLLRREGRARLVGPGNEPAIELPGAVYSVLMDVLNAMRQGSAISLVPVTQDLTTQEAAELLGVSRPHFVKLLESGELSFHAAGTHRRVYLKDLMAYKEQRDQRRRKALDQIAEEADAAGFYDQVILPSAS
jgi:excisionase family DNA binding protein